MTVHARVGRHQVARQTNRRIMRGYAEHRRAYDARRRRELAPGVREENRAWARVLRADLCSYCMDFCGQMAADHIVALADGGEDAVENMTAAGRPCNAAKKDKKLLIFLAERSAR